ncbi:MAG: hypothetical protein IT357_19125 [Gemmatimonadaceae bacterium]|nr:hypothetical protein [Gemmatimonadaceae bacterium]
MASAKLRFALFVAIVLALPAALMASTDAELRDLGKLAMIVSPAIAGFALAPRSPRRASHVSWRWVSGAAIITLLVALGALAVAVAVGAASVALTPTPFRNIASAVGASALTSVLEELGWAAGGLALATAAYGRRWGVLALGTVWAAWHLIPVALHVGLFPYLEAAPPLMIAAFVASCLIYRELLTQLRERSNSWLGAAAGHAAPNIVLAGLIAAGVTLPPGRTTGRSSPRRAGSCFRVSRSSRCSRCAERPHTISSRAKGPDPAPVGPATAATEAISRSFQEESSATATTPAARPHRTP